MINRKGFIKILIFVSLFFELFVNQPIFGVPLRLVVFYTTSLLLFLIFFKQKIFLEKKINKIFNYYLIYIFLIIFISFFNGDFELVRFLKIISSRILPIIFIFFIFSKIFFHKDFFLFTLSSIKILLFCHVFLTLSQNLNFDFAWRIIDFLNIDVSYVNNSSYLFEPKNVVSIVSPGLASFEVPSGYYILAIVPLTFTFNSVFLRSLLLLVIFSTILIIGQRSVLIIGLLISALFIFSTGVKKSRFIVVTSIILMLLFLYNLDLEFINIKFKEFTLNDNVRFFYLVDSINYSLNNIFIGGETNYLNNQFKFYSGESLTPHNLFVNSLLRGGILAFLLVVYISVLIFRKFIFQLKKWRFSRLKADYLNFSIVSSALVIFLNSFFHNAGLNSFDTFFWWFIILSNSTHSND